MTNFDWKSAIQTIAPAIATALGGPLAGVAVGTLGKAILGNENASENDVQQAILTGLSPEAIVRLKEIDKEFSLELQRIALQNKQEDYKNEETYLHDTQDARKWYQANHEIDWLAITIMVSFGLIVGIAMWGSFAALTGGIIIKDAATVGMITTFLGTVFGWVAANAQQVVSFRYGSSKGSDKRNEAMINAFKSLNKE